jgi:hypothetical protein
LVAAHILSFLFGQCCVHLCYQTIKEVDGALAELTLIFEQFGTLCVEGFIVGDELLGTELDAAFALLLIPIVDTCQFD